MARCARDGPTDRGAGRSRRSPPCAAAGRGSGRLRVAAGRVAVRCPEQLAERVAGRVASPPTGSAVPTMGRLLLRLTTCSHTCGTTPGTTFLDDGRILWEAPDGSGQ